MKNRNLPIAAFLGMIAIVLGAFAAHSLKENIGVDSLKNFETGVRYQIYHVILLLIVNTYSGISLTTKNYISFFFFIGILFFSGSLYILSLGMVNPKYIWFVTPLGGLFFIIGWARLMISFIKKEQNVNK